MINEKNILKNPKLNKPDKKEKKVIKERNLSNLSRYIEDIHSENPGGEDAIPLIKKIEEKLNNPNQKDKIELEKEIKEIRNKIILQELHFVIAIAKDVRREFFPNGPKNVLEDLIQYGNIGLIKCIDLFIKKLYNGEKTKFSFTYARYYIRNSIIEGANYILRDVRVPLKIIAFKIPQYEKTKEQLTWELGRSPSIEEISKRLGWEKEEVKKVIRSIKTLSLRNYVFLDQEIKPGERKHNEIIADKDSLDMIEQVFEKEREEKMAEIIKKVLPSLTDKEKKFLEMILNGYPSVEISRKWGESRTSVYNVRKTVIRKLKDALGK